MIHFRKMHGLGNDFVIIDCRDGTKVLETAAIRQVADRKKGVGCDQLIHLLPPQTPETDIFLDMYNADGSPLEACGNATRCVADILMDEKGQDTIVIETVAGLLYCSRAGEGLITADMGSARLKWDEIPLSKECDTLHLPLEGDPVGVSVGNPHCVFFVPDADKAAVADIGPKIETDLLFPNRTNVEFVSVIDQAHLRMRVWERGTGITQACGSGACAAGVAAIRRGLTGRKVTITLDGGDLIIEWRENDGHVLMTGPVAYSFEGTISV